LVDVEAEDTMAAAVVVDASVEAAEAFWALVREAPLTPPVGEVEVWKPERARKADRKLEKKGRFVLIVKDYPWDYPCAIL
jgi:hypothetical protein